MQPLLTVSEADVPRKESIRFKFASESFAGIAGGLSELTDAFLELFFDGGSTAEFFVQL